MSKEALRGSFAVLSSLGVASVFLPSVDKAWGAYPADVHFEHRMRTAQATFIVLALTLGGMQAAITGSSMPVVVAILLVIYMLGLYEMAFRTPPP